MASDDYSYLANKVSQLEPKRDWRRSVDKLTVTNEQVEEISDSQPLWCDSIFHQKSHVWVAPPNGGKTTIATSAAADLAKDGYEVLYFNLDAGAADLKYYQGLAESSGYRLIAPLEAGTSEAHCISVITQMLEDDDLSDCVVFLDTLKKFTDVISKQNSKKFYANVRGLTIRGCTVIALAHTNKHPDSDGKLVYEGTGDLKSDFDIMMMLYPSKSDTALTVSTEFEKERAIVKPQTFVIDSARSVKLSGDYTNTRELEHVRRQEAHDSEVIDFIKDLISRKPMNQSAVIAACKDAGMGNRKPTMRVLRAYKNRFWTCERGLQNNELRYISMDYSP